VSEGEPRQVLSIVLFNALDAMEGKGSLALETGKAGEAVFVRIADSGPGIPPAALQRIFDPFFTTKADRGGTGLGLSIAWRIVDELGGRIQAASQQGRGACFTLVLPA
jgi:signal transduction histidine kinase